jgi:uncharacterized membrane protein YuzA (DUF378 family)
LGRRGRSAVAAAYYGVVMVRLVAWPVGLLVVAVVVLVAGGGDVVTQAIGLALIGIAAVVAVSLTFFYIGRSEDEDRAAASAKRPPEPERGPPPPDRERPALKRRRPLPPRRPG